MVMYPLGGVLLCCVVWAEYLLAQSSLGGLMDWTLINVQWVETGDLVEASCI
jgi:hypothetical protein